MKIFDLTHGITHGMGVFPGDPECVVESAHSYENGYFVSRISMGTHTGTHVDAPAHKIKGARSLTDLGLEAFIAPNTAAIDCRGRQGEMDAAFIESCENELKGCDGAVFVSGWSKKWGTPEFFEGFPGFSEDAAAALKRLGIRLVGVETPSVNCVRHESVHAALLREEIVVAEALRVPENLFGRFELYAAPLKLVGRDGSPVRAFALKRGQ